MPDYGTPLEESMGALHGLVDEGKARAFGMSNHPAWKLVESHQVAERQGWTAPRVNQQVYNLLARRTEDACLRCTDEIGMANLVFNPVAGGLLTWKHQRHVAPDPETRFALNPAYPARYWNDEQLTAAEALDRIARDAGVDLIGPAFRWLLSRSGIDGVILGVSSLEQLRSNLDGVAGPAPDDAMCAAIDETWRTLAGVAPLHYRAD